MSQPSTTRRLLPDGTRAAQGSPEYFKDVWAADKGLEQWLKQNPDVVRAIEDGRMRIDYQLVHVDADGVTTITALALTDDVLKTLKFP